MRSLSTNENLALRIVALNVISFTTPIIQNPRASLPGPQALAVSCIKKIGISSAALCAFTKFTANGCSEYDSLREAPDAISAITVQPRLPHPHRPSGTVVPQS